MHGYAIAALDDLAARVVRNNLHWWAAGDRGDQHAVAWEGIAEHLCSAATTPAERDLLEAGRRALAREVKDNMRHHGARRDGTNDGTNFARYWLWQARVSPSPEASVTDGLALRQILAALTARQQEAVSALAARGDYMLAAEMCGIRPQTFRSLIGRARREFLRLWHEGEEPSRPWGCDRRVYRRETSDPAELSRRARGAAAARERRKARARRVTGLPGQKAS
jgi:DNA-directed RNA polymerase specialized sigma24 family protein